MNISRVNRMKFLCGDRIHRTYRFDARAELYM